MKNEFDSIKVVTPEVAKRYMTYIMNKYKFTVRELSLYISGVEFRRNFFVKFHKTTCEERQYIGYMLVNICRQSFRSWYTFMRWYSSNQKNINK